MMPNDTIRPNDSLILAIDVGTENARVGLVDLEGHSRATASADYPTFFDKPGWVEQDPADWWNAIRTAIRDVMSSEAASSGSVSAISVDATGSTVLFLDQTDSVIGRAIMWMDLRATEEARLVAEAAANDEFIAGAYIPTAEWMPSKALWCKLNRPDVWESSRYVMEATDWLVWKMTGQVIGSTSLAATRGMHRPAEGWPSGLFAATNLDDLESKLPQTILPPGTVAGKLSPAAAKWLGLKSGISVAVGVVDAAAAMVGVGAVTIGQLAFITGSSHLILGPVDAGTRGWGLFGPFPDSLYMGGDFIEASQSSSGSILRWFRGICGTSTDDFYHKMDRMAEDVPVGSGGLMVLDYLQGNRTPHSDSTMGGALLGLTLGHGREHIYRAILEGVAFGTAAACDCLRDAGVHLDMLLATGGATKSPLWMQITSDVTGLPIKVAETSEAALVGGSVLASVATGQHPDLQTAVAQMVRYQRTYQPNPGHALAYRELVETYKSLYAILKPPNDVLVRYRNVAQ